MTIVVNLTVPEGIVFAADSRQTFVNEGGDVRVSSDFGAKLFQLSNSSAAVTFGLAFLNERSVFSYIKDFRKWVGDSQLPLEKLASRLGQHMNEAYRHHVDQGLSKPVEKDTYAVGFLVGGYDPGDKHGKVYEVYVPSGEIYLRRVTDESPGAAWRGQTSIITRLLLGYDANLADLKGFTPELKKTLDECALEYRVDYWGMTLQDAVDYAQFLVRTTIEMQRFSDGTAFAPGSSASCGGAIDLAVIDSEEGFRWLQHKQLRPSYNQPAGYNPSET